MRGKGLIFFLQKLLSKLEKFQLPQFMENLEFDTPQYRAVSDYLHLKDLEKNLAVEQGNATSYDKDPKKKVYWESQTRITEQEIALHNLQIYNNRSRVEGYDRAYSQVGIALEFSLFDAARHDAESLFTNDQKRSNFVRDFLDRVSNKAYELVMTKRK